MLVEKLKVVTMEKLDCKLEFKLVLDIASIPLNVLYVELM